MSEKQTVMGKQLCIEIEEFHQLVDALHAHGYEIIGPTLHNDVIVYDTVDAVDDLPAGWTDWQEAGAYRLLRRQDDALFGYRVSPHAWKRFLYPPVVRLWRARRSEDGFEIEVESEDAPRYALLGVRPCELHAIAIQDRIFLEGDYVDPIYQKRRQNLFIVAVNCTEPGNTCFCASLGAGPKAAAGFDLALTEILEKDRHYFVATVGSAQGAEMIDSLPFREADPVELAVAERLLAAAAAHMGRTLDTTDLRSLLYRNLEHPRWAEIANRCLTCGNCTLVCPTCFCTTVEDVTDLDGEGAERWRKWDSCFTLDFSYIHGGSVRASAGARYRQWLTHKLAGWVDQFGVFGCVGCGRCITWCPVAIDITAEIEAIRRTERSEVASETTSP